MPKSYRTADSLFEALMMDTPVSLGAGADFGIDRNPKLYAVYQRLVREGKVTADQLDEAARSDKPGPVLTKLIGTLVMTTWDDYPEELKE